VCIFILNIGTETEEPIGIAVSASGLPSVILKAFEQRTRAADISVCDLWLT